MLAVYFNYILKNKIDSTVININVLIFIGFLNLLFVKFNIIVRFVNVMFKTTINYIKNKDKLCSFNILISYYLFNITCLTIIILFVTDFEFNLIQFDSSVGYQIKIYTSLLAVIFAIVYLYHTFNDKINNKHTEITTIGKIFSTFFIFCMTFSLFVIIFNYFNPILCDTGDDNREINQNTQYSNTPNNNNDQTNANNQTNNLNDSSINNGQSSNNSGVMVQRSNKGSVNIQNTTSSRWNLININNKQVYPYSSSNFIDDDITEALVSDARSNLFKIYNKTEIFIAKKIKTIPVDNSLLFNSNHQFSQYASLFCKLKSIDPNALHLRYFNVPHINSNLDSNSSALITFNNNSSALNTFYNKNVDFRMLSFNQIYLANKNQLVNSSIDGNCYRNNFQTLIEYAVTHDSLNRFLEDIKRILLGNPNQNQVQNIIANTSNVSIALENKLIYLHNSYSVLIKDSDTNTAVFIDTKGSNFLELFHNNKTCIDNLYNEIKQCDNNFIGQNNLPHTTDVLITFRARIGLNNLLCDNYSGEIKHLYLISNKIPVFISLHGDYMAPGKFYYYNNYQAYILKHPTENGHVKYFVKIVDTNTKMFNVLYQEFHHCCDLSKNKITYSSEINNSPYVKSLSEKYKAAELRENYSQSIILQQLISSNNANSNDINNINFFNKK